MKITLRDYQVEAIKSFTEARALKTENRFLLTAAVGAGKTIITSQIMSDEVRQRGGRCLFLCHRDELIRQTIDKLTLVDEGLRVSVVQAWRDEWRDSDITVASIQTLSKRRLARIPIDYYSLIVVDETHRVTANIYRRVLDHFGCFEDEWKTTLLGITATSKRTDGVSLDTVFQRHIFDIGMLELIEKDALVPIRAITIETQTNLNGVKKKKDDFAEGELAAVLNTANRNALISEAIVKYAPDRKSLVFCASVQHAKDLSLFMRKYGINTVAVHGGLSISERRSILADYEAGHIQALTTVQLLVEGLDCPSVNCVVWATATMSLIKYTQGIGRGTRLSPETGKTDLLVFDCANNYSKHSLMTVPKLFGVGEAGDLALKSGKTIIEAMQVNDEEKKAVDKAAAYKKEQEEIRKEGHGISAHSVNLFQSMKLPRILECSDYDWQIISQTRLFVPLIYEQVHLRQYPSDGVWYVLSVDHSDGYKCKRLLAKEESFVKAVYRAESYLDAKGWVIPTMKKWAKMEPTPAQFQAFKRLGEQIPADKRSAFTKLAAIYVKNYFHRNA
jgi:ATP-dependent helicase IRC3